jgi:hypothetical protein
LEGVTDPGPIFLIMPFSLKASETSTIQQLKTSKKLIVMLKPVEA